MAVLSLKIAIAVSTYGSTDVLIFEADLAKIRGDGGEALYRHGITTEWCGQPGQRPCPPFNHPPFMIHALEAWGTLGLLSGLPLGFWIRLTCAVADVGSLVLVIHMLGTRAFQARIALALFAASPVAILISGFHGNTDPITMFFVLLSIRLAGSQRPALAGVALGMAMNVKIVPLLLAPAALLSLPGRRGKLQFLGGAIAVFLAGSLQILVVAPELMITNVFGYGSQSGLWGLSLLALASREILHLSWLYEFYAQHGKILSLCFVLAATLWLGPHPAPSALFKQAGFLMFLFVSMTPGFGVQYLAWLVPWVVVLGWRPTVTYYLVGGVFLSAYYTAAAGRFPWYLANSLEHRAWTGIVLSLGLICWLVVCRTSLIYFRSLRASPVQSL